jgi:hypothetical protein
MQCDVPGTFAASSIKRVVAYRMVPWNGVPGSSGQIRIIQIDNSVFTSGQFN